MREPIRSFFDRRLHAAEPDTGEPDTGPARPGAADAARDRLHLAACALLLELAHADDEFSGSERTHIEAVLRRHFGLDAGTASELMELAEAERQATGDLHPFASLIRSSYDRGQRALLAEIMWGLILADGQIAHREAYLLRRIAGLLDLEPGYLAEPRRGAD